MPPPAAHPVQHRSSARPGEGTSLPSPFRRGSNRGWTPKPNSRNNPSFEPSWGDGACVSTLDDERLLRIISELLLSHNDFEMGLQATEGRKETSHNRKPSLQPQVISINPSTNMLTAPIARVATLMLSFGTKEHVVTANEPGLRPKDFHRVAFNKRGQCNRDDPSTAGRFSWFAVVSRRNRTRRFALSSSNSLPVLGLQVRHARGSAATARIPGIDGEFEQPSATLAQRVRSLVPPLLPA